MTNAAPGNDTDEHTAQRPANVVFLRGRLAADPVEKQLPSGDVLLSFRLTVERPPSRQATGRARVDSLECVAVKAVARRTVSRAAPGDELEVEGSLQRRFWRGPAGPASRYAVSVDVVRRCKPVKRSATGGTLSPARRRGGASPGRKPASG